MAFKFIVVACFATFANAGLLGEPILGYSATPVLRSDYIQPANIPVAHAAPLAIHNPTYGSSHQSVERSLGGAQSISHYSKAIDSAFSSVRKYDTRITNDALSVAHAPIVAKQLAPAVAYSAAPIVAKAVAPIAYSGPAIAYSSAPAVSSAYIHQAQPLLAKAVAPVAAYAPLLTKSVAAPVVSTYASPLITKSIAAPLVSTYSAPLVTKSIATPVISAYSAPVPKAAIAYSPATVVAHTTFTGLGTAYEW